MKIIGVGRNYAAHAEELGNNKPSEPVIFLKPDTALLKDNAPFYHPEFSKDIHHEVELVLRICKEGKNIQEKFAHKYYDAIGIGIDFTARDLQDKLKSEGLPWTLAKGFNGSAPISNEFIPIEKIKDLNNIHFSLNVNGATKQKGSNKEMIFHFDFLIAFISKFITLKKGDLIFTGTPKGVGAVKIGDQLEAFMDDQKMLECEIK
jgi:acylpyruvate hydrolase